MRGKWLESKTMKHVILSIIVALSLSACGRQTCWVERSEPVTDQERAATALIEVSILKSPAMDDHRGQTRGWDNAITAAHEIAKETACKKRMWEEQREGWDGIWE